MPSVPLLLSEAVVILGAVALFKGRSKMKRLDALGLSLVLMAGLFAVQFSVPVLERAAVETRELALADERARAQPGAVGEETGVVPPPEAPKPEEDAPKSEGPALAGPGPGPSLEEGPLASKLSALARPIDPLMTARPGVAVPLPDVDSAPKARPKAEEAKPRVVARPALAPEGAVTTVSEANLRGIAKFTAKDYKGAVLAFDEAIKSAPENFKAHYNRGLAHHQLKDLVQARRDFDSAIRLNPTELVCRISRASLFLKTNDHESAVDDLSVVIGQDPNNALAHRLRAKAYEALGEPQRAKADRERAAGLANSGKKAI